MSKKRQRKILTLWIYLYYIIALKVVFVLSSTIFLVEVLVVLLHREESHCYWIMPHHHHHRNNQHHPHSSSIVQVIVVNVRLLCCLLILSSCIFLPFCYNWLVDLLTEWQNYTHTYRHTCICNLNRTQVPTHRDLHTKSTLSSYVQATCLNPGFSPIFCVPQWMNASGYVNDGLSVWKMCATNAKKPALPTGKAKETILKISCGIACAQHRTSSIWFNIILSFCVLLLWLSFGVISRSLVNIIINYGHVLFIIMMMSLHHERTKRKRKDFYG